MYNENSNRLPLICVCQTASPTPQRPAMAKKINLFSGCGRQKSITITIAPWTIAPVMQIKFIIICTYESIVFSMVNYLSDNFNLFFIMKKEQIW